jgi:hypothetical protein
MDELQLVQAVVAQVNTSIAAGQGNFSVALSADGTQLVLSSTPVSNPAPTTTNFPVTNPTQVA